jgi:hypothetical protein
VAYSNLGKTRAGMGIDTGDTTNTGNESLLIGNNAGQGLAQFLASSAEATGSQFTDVAEQTGLFTPSLPFLTFGLAFVDYDGDGFKDIVTANGHVDERVQQGSKVEFEQTLLAFHNQGNGQFVPSSDRLGPGFQEKRVWRGLAVGDYDSDGDPDLLLSTCDGKPALLRNDGGNRDHWLQLRLRGTKSNRDGLGTRIVLQAGGMKQTAWVRSGGSYCSESERVARFGLGTAARADQIELHWPSGVVQTLRDVKTGQVLLVTEPGQ